MTTEKILYATEAKADSQQAQAGNLEKAIERIAQNSKLGFEEVLLFGIGLNLEGVKKLMAMIYLFTLERKVISKKLKYSFEVGNKSNTVLRSKRRNSVMIERKELFKPAVAFGVNLIHSLREIPGFEL